MHQNGEQHDTSADPRQLPDGPDGAMPVEQAQASLTYGDVLAQHPEMHPLLVEHVERLAAGELSAVTVPPASLETVDSATLLDAEANISHHDWGRIGAESSPSDAHDVAHNTLAAKFGATNADPATKLEVAVEAELGAGAVTTETPSEKTITIVHDSPDATSAHESAQNTDGERGESPGMPPGWGKLTDTNVSDREFMSKRQERIDQLLSGEVGEQVVDTLLTEGLWDAFHKAPEKFPEAIHQKLVESMAENGISGFIDKWDKLPGVLTGA